MITTTILLVLNLWQSSGTFILDSDDVLAMRDLTNTTVSGCAVTLDGYENDILFADSCSKIKLQLGLK